MTVGCWVWTASPAGLREISEVGVGHYAQLLSLLEPHLCFLSVPVHWAQLPNLCGPHYRFLDDCESLGIVSWSPWALERIPGCKWVHEYSFAVPRRLTYGSFMWTNLCRLHCEFLDDGGLLGADSPYPLASETVPHFFVFKSVLHWHCHLIVETDFFYDSLIIQGGNA